MSRMDGMTQRAREGGAAMYRMDEVFREEPGKAVRLCPWMESIPRRAREGGAVMSMDGRADNCSSAIAYMDSSVYTTSICKKV